MKDAFDAMPNSFFSDLANPLIVQADGTRHWNSDEFCSCKSFFVPCSGVYGVFNLQHCILG